MPSGSLLDALNQRARNERDRYGPNIETVQLNVRIPRPVKDRLDQVVKGLRVSAGEYVQAMLEDVLPRSEAALDITP